MKKTFFQVIATTSKGRSIHYTPGCGWCLGVHTVYTCLFEYYLCTWVCNCWAERELVVIQIMYVDPGYWCVCGLLCEVPVQHVRCYPRKHVQGLLT